MLEILVFYVEFRGAKNPHVLLALNWDCQWHWRFLIGVWDHDLDFLKFAWVLEIYGSNLGFLCWVWRCKGPSCPYCLELGLWMMLEVPDWIFGSWVGFYQICLGPRNPCYKLGFSLSSLKVQGILMSLLPWIGAVDEAGGSWLEFWILSWIFVTLFGS